MEEEDLFERFMEEILASLEATSTEDGSAKRVTTAIWSDKREENPASVQMSDSSPGSKSKQTSSASFWLDNGKVGVMKKTIAWLQALPSLLSSPVPPLLPC